MKKVLNSRFWGVLGVMFSVLLTACGGASSTVNPLVPARVIAFGDALSTVNASGQGTYTVQTGETDNTVAGRLASRYSIALNGTLSQPLASTGGFSYASGSARVSDVVTQINTFLTQVNNVVGSKDLIVITVGDLDIYDAAPTNNTAAISTAVQNLVAAIRRLTTAGAQYVVIMQPLNMARTPWAVTNSLTTNAQGLSYDTGTACMSFSCQLTAQLNIQYPATSGHQPVLLADLASYFNLITGTTGTGNANTFASYGVANPDVVACTVNTPSCTTSTVTSGTNSWNGVAWDYTTSIFADNLNLTPFANRLLADYIYTTSMYRAGWR